MHNESFDDIIKRYTEELEIMGQNYGGEVERMVVKPSETEDKGASEETTTESKEEGNTVNEAVTDEISPKNDATETESALVNTDPAVNDSAQEDASGEVTSTADFSAVVFAGEGAYPVEGAKIVVYRNDDIYAFLQSDENGRTKKVKLPAFSKENTLIPDNPESNINYFADVFAEGFIAQKGLLVSSVGGSEILLRVLLVPEEERIG